MVRNPTKNPLQGATVILIDQRSSEKRKLETNANGSCRFADLAAGECLLQVSAAGFAAVPLPVRVKVQKASLSAVDLQPVSTAPTPTGKADSSAVGLSPC